MPQAASREEQQTGADEQQTGADARSRGSGGVHVDGAGRERDDPLTLVA